MKYNVKHITKYIYDFPASLCHNIVYQIPSAHPFQKLVNFDCEIDPEPTSLTRRKDFFENEFIYFSLQKTHQKLTVTSQSAVELVRPSWMDINPGDTPAWESVVDILHTTEVLNDIRQFYLESPFVPSLSDIKDYASESFFPGRPIMDSMLDLNQRINQDFTFTPGFTEISTPLREVFAEKKGVCQDFAHFGLACARSMGLAARYVSGYIETVPPPGQPKLVGADASHAWIAVYIPEVGWLEFDSTNNLLVNDQHIRVATGRDFGDVIPMKGVVYSGGGQTMDVSVDVMQVE
ncbi:MAG: transglutaminase family protein [Cyclobacteriaceae bacterium]|nr:transglutaminase family protein [Cyclobacteriaceae bacterium SS2]